jgi:hypothetical protein
MVTTRRSLHIETADELDPRRGHKRHKQLVDTVIGIQPKGPGYQACFNLLRSLFQVSMRGYWYRILPVDGMHDDISIATGVEWTYLLPLLMKLGLIVAKVTSVVKEIQVVKRQWDEFGRGMAASIRLETTSIRRKKQPRAYFFCLGDPIWSNPINQNKSDMIVLVELPPEGKQLRTKIKRTVNGILRRRLIGRVNGECNLLHVADSIDASTITTVAGMEEEEVMSLASVLEQRILFALALDLNRRPRLSRTAEAYIPILDSKQADERSRHLVIHTAQRWGWRDPFLTQLRRLEIAKAACRQVAFDLGYSRPLAHSRLPYWYVSLGDAIDSGENLIDIDPVSPSHCGSTSYVQTVEETNPEYLRELYRYAEGVKGLLSTFHETVEVMNLKSSCPGETRPTLSLSRKQLSAWFQQQGGKEISSTEKPLLTDDHKRKRVLWSRKYFDLFSNPTVPIAFLDEKWFYTTNRRKSLKVLPKVASETTLKAYKRPSIRSRRYPVKVMYLGVVAQPRTEHSFDGRILLERVSRRKKLVRSSRNKRFSVDVHVNEEIVAGKWKERFVMEDTTTIEVLEMIADVYDLDEFVSDRLELVYVTHSTGGTKQIKRLDPPTLVLNAGSRTTKEGQLIPITMDHLELFVHMKMGDEVDEDTSCDSKFMLECMPRVGAALREQFHWVPQNEIVYVCMDNAGGHGTNDAKLQYINLLKEFNVEVIWQVPRSPETNMLDLGVWMSIQCSVMNVHYGRKCHHDALAKSVEEAWNGYLSQKAFTNVYNRLRVVLTCIVDDNGGNRLVESKRGKLFRDATIIDLTDENDPIQPEILDVDLEDDNLSVTSL